LVLQIWFSCWIEIDEVFPKICWLPPIPETLGKSGLGLGLGLGFKFFYLFKIYKVLHVFDKYNNYKKKYNNKNSWLKDFTKYNYYKN